MNLFRREMTGVGVDFGTSSIKVVQLSGDGKRIALATYASAPQPNILSQATSPDAVARMAVVLREILQKGRVGRGALSAALPVLSVFSTVLELPELPEKELASAVMLLAKNYVPSPLAEVVLGWTSIGPPEKEPGRTDRVPTANEGVAAAPATASGPAADEPPGKTPRPTQEVFLTAAPRDLVQRYAAVFERLNTTLTALEVESFPLARSLLREDRRPTLLVDFGNRTTSYSIVERGYLRLNQAVDIGGETLTTAVAHALSLPPAEAEKRKRAEGLLPLGSRGAGGAESASAVSAALRPPLLEIITRGEVIRRLYEKKRGRALALVQLIGGGSRLPGLASFWTSVTGLPCEVGNPWKGIAVPTALSELLKRQGPSFAVAVGLALRPFEQLR